MSNSEVQQNDENRRIDENEEEIERDIPRDISPNLEDYVQEVDEMVNTNDSENKNESSNRAHISTAPASEQNKNSKNSIKNTHEMKIVVRNDDEISDIISYDCNLENDSLDEINNLDKIEDNLFSTKKKNN